MTTQTYDSKYAKGLELKQMLRSIIAQTNLTIESKGYQTSSNVASAISNALSSYYTQTQINQKFQDLGTVMDYKGSVATVADLNLISNPEAGDVYKVTATNDTYVWSGTVWEKLGANADLTGYATESYVQSAIQALGHVMEYKGSVATMAALEAIQNPGTGDVYNVTATGENFCWDGSAWDNLGSVVDLSGYAQLSDIPTQMTDQEVEDLITNALGGYTGDSLADVAFSGSYNDLVDKPDLSVFLTLTDLVNTVHIISFDANTGTGTMRNKGCFDGELITLPACSFIPPSGYKFKEWNTSSDGNGTSYNPQTTFTPDNDATIYAIWEAE